MQHGVAVAIAVVALACCLRTSAYAIPMTGAGLSENVFHKEQGLSGPKPATVLSVSEGGDTIVLLGLACVCLRILHRRFVHR